MDLGGFAQPVSLSVNGLPESFSYQFSPNPVTPTPGAGNRSTLLIDSLVRPQAGTYSVTIVGTAGSQIRAVSFDLIVY